MPSNNVELLEVIYKTPTLKNIIDEALDAGSKINAIKELRGWCETSDNPNWLTDGTRVSLRLMKDVVDRYERSEKLRYLTTVDIHIYQY